MLVEANRARMSFDRLAPHYRWMEGLLAGGKLQRCRIAFLKELPPVCHALLLGEGNGRFLSEFVQAQPTAKVTCVDASGLMLNEARRRARGPHAIEFVCSDVLAWRSPERQFDLVVSNFFLDCFRAEQIEHIVNRVSQAAQEQACWLIADFREPPRGWRKWRARLILRSMYWFFRWATSLPADRLSAPDRFLAQNGFCLQARRSFEWGLLGSDLWARRQVGCEHRKGIRRVAARDAFV